MPQFLYFFPGASAVDDAALERAGLAHLVGAPRRSGHIDRGPGGGPGCLVSLAGADDGPLAWIADAQQWPDGPTDRGFRIGFTKGAAPGPADLARPDLIDGYPVTLGDGREWTVPLARVLALGGARQRRLRLGPNGQWTLGPAVDRIAALEADAAELWEDVMGQYAANAEAVKAGAGAAPVTLRLLPELAVRALAVNYRVGPDEVDVLGLLSTENLVEIEKALIDWPSVEQAAKKVIAAAPPSGG